MDHYDYLEASYSLEKLNEQLAFLHAQYKKGLINDFDYENQVADIQAAIELQTNYYY
jgi:hypothetical protein